MQKWEYIYVITDPKNGKTVAQELSDFGEEGWEAVGISEMETHGRGYDIPVVLSVLLKRPKN
jgi:hypothetical protein